MNERLTLVSLFNKDEIKKIEEILSEIDERLCKVPFGRNVNRFEVDTLPYHFTLSSWNVNEKDNVINKLSKIKFSKLKITIDSIGIMNGKENSYVLYFGIQNNELLTEIQKNVYDALPTEKYNPAKFKFHITIHIDKDYEKILLIKELIEKTFKPIELEVSEFGLYSIYPSKLIKQFE